MPKLPSKLWLSLTLVPAAVLVAAWFLVPGIFYGFLVGAERIHSGLYRAEVQVGNQRIVYLEGGEGEPLLLLHGFGANKDNWARVARYLTPRFRVVIPDLPGFGESDFAEGGDYSIPAQVERIDALADTLGLTRFHLGGSSMGGNIAGVFAGVHPERVRSLWLLAPLGVAGADPSEMARMMAAGNPSPLIISDPDAFGGVMDFVFARRPWFPEPVLDQLARESAARFHHYQWIQDQIVERHAGMPAPATPLEPLLEGSDIPTLIVWGEADRVLHVSGAARLAAVLDRARVVVMPATGHLPMIERPEACAADFLAFADGLDRPAAPPQAADDRD